MWIYITLGALVLIGFGAALFMAGWKEGARSVVARRTRNITTIKSGNVEELVVKIIKQLAPALAEQMAEKFAEKISIQVVSAPGVGHLHRDTDRDNIKIDERIIPVSMNVDVETENLEGMVKEEETEDKGLAASKSKLAGLFKKKET